MEKKYTVEEFVQMWDDGEIGEGDIIVRAYSPIIEKQTVLNTLISKCVLKDSIGLEYMDSFLLKINFVAALLILYTNLEISHESDEKTFFDDYDLLVSRGIVNNIMSMIDDDEIRELNAVFESLLDNFRERNYSTRAFVSKIAATAVEQIVGSSSVLLEEIAKYLKKEDIK